MKTATTRKYSTGNTWAVGSKKYAISAPSAAIALRYGVNVSRGIGMMEKKIQEQQKEIEAYSKFVRETV